MSSYDPQLALRQTIAGVLDAPSVYMGGPSRQNLQKADRIIERLRSDSRLMDALRAGMETGATPIARFECAYCQRKYATAEVRNDHQDNCDPRNALNR